MSALTSVVSQSLTPLTFDSGAFYTLLGKANDGQAAELAQITGQPLFSAVGSAAAVAADTVAFDFTGATIAGLNLASGESRAIRAIVQSTGALITANTYFESTNMISNIAGTLTQNAVLNNLYNNAGVVTVTIAWSLAGAGATARPVLTVTVPATVTAANYRCDLFLLGPKGK